MESSLDDFEIVDEAHDDVYRDRGELSAGVEDCAVPRQSAINERKDQSENIVLSLNGLDLADFILDDLSPDDFKQQSDSEFSFLELPEPQDRERLLDGDYTGSTTPTSSAWSLLDCDFSSDNDVASSEIGYSPNLINDDDSEEQKTERIPSTCNPVENKREMGKRRRKHKKKSDGLMMELFGGLSVCQFKEDAGLPGFVESSSGPSLSNIPTLVDLCMQKIHLYRKSHLIKKLIKSSHFPVGMRRTILSSNIQYSITKSKLLWLWQNIAVLESMMTNYFPKTNTSFYCVSNIWKEVDNSVLLEACFIDSMNPGCFLYGNVEYYLVYTTLMAIMLANPSKYIEERKRLNVKKPAKSKRLSKNAPSKHLTILHQYLKSRYPQMTAVFFSRSLPYAYWARGNFRAALQAFVTQYKEESLSDKEKLFIIGEIGRLYAMIYEPEKAIRMYSLLGNCLIQAKPWESETTECQTLVLIADLQNQGVFTESKARNLIPSWKAIFRVCPSDWCTELYQEAAECMLCLHLGNLKDGNHLEMVKCVLHEYSQHNGKIWYHLAFLNAITGSSKSSDNSYGEFVKCFETLDSDDSNTRRTIPGMQMVDLLSKRKLACHDMDALQLAIQNPFEPLLSLELVPAMKVIWRRQFHHCHGHNTNYESCNGFDISNSDLKLRMTTEGFITGDCSMIYPPIASVLLDPYTGSLILEADMYGINPWKELPFTTLKTCLIDQLFSLPNMVEIFHREDQDGDTSAYLAGNHFFSENSDTRTWWGYAHSLTKVDSVLNVHWSGPGGQRAKFSLVQKIKDYIYQDVKLEVQRCTSSENVREVTSIIEKWYRKGLAVSNTDVSRVIKQLFDAKDKKKKIPVHHGYKPNKFWLKFVAPLRRIGSSVLLTIRVSQNLYYVIIDCQNRNSFVNPIILGAGERDIIHSSVRSAYFCIERNDGKLTVYDRSGNVVSVQKVSTTGTHIDKVTLIESNCIFSIRKSSRLGLLDINSGFTKYFDDFLECEYVGVLLDVLILKNEYGIKFADGQQKCLKPMLVQLHSTLQHSNLPFKISENGEQLNGNFEHVENLAEDGREMGAIAVDNFVILFTVRTSQNSLREIIFTQVLELPGLPVKLKFLHKSGVVFL
ncbi:uncharacterized protein LOC125680556 isoform X2 [Ostrea edulis]|uniref:uncharacterized protein LOC125680556 isoform X2 n=1 Tax=Ostrea edulis TaxID=37623 RepID=UPI0024AF96A1|nr:uncharacterized protein LOC125680556 isoform X2 [Ostrea edulis]